MNQDIIDQALEKQRQEESLVAQTEAKSNSNNPWKFGFFAMFFIWVLTLVGGIYYFNQESRLIVANTPIRTPAPEIETVADEPGSCVAYGKLRTERFLQKYTVQKGDTLLSIAEEQLGDTSRASEIVAINKYQQTFPELSLSNPFVEVGWELYLPPKGVEQTAGNIQAYAGEIVEIDNQGFVIEFDGKGGGRVNITDQTKFLLKERDEYERGDCIYQIEDVRSTDVRVLYVVPLEDETLVEFNSLVENQ